MSYGQRPSLHISSRCPRYISNSANSSAKPSESNAQRITSHGSPFTTGGMKNLRKSTNINQPCVNTSGKIRTKCQSKHQPVV